MPGAIVHFQRADWRVRSIAAMLGLEPIADCTLGILQCTVPRFRGGLGRRHYFSASCGAVP
eukprot:5397514-Alexandrium_andersonii.AAC.1